LWKQLERVLVYDVIMRCVLCSNLRQNNKFLKALVTFRFLRIGINALGVHAAQPTLSWANFSKFFCGLVTA